MEILTGMGAAASAIGVVPIIGKGVSKLVNRNNLDSKIYYELKTTADNLYAYIGLYIYNKTDDVITNLKITYKGVEITKPIMIKPKSDKTVKLLYMLFTPDMSDTFKTIIGNKEVGIEDYYEILLDDCAETFKINIKEMIEDITQNSIRY